MKEKKPIQWIVWPEKIFGIDSICFLIFAVIVLAIAWIGIIPSGLVGQLAIIISFAGICYTLGGMFPGIRDVGGAVLCPLILLPILKSTGIMPEEVGNAISSFMATGYQNFYIAAILVGSILAMNRQVLLKSVLRYVPTIILGQLAGILFLWLGSVITGVNPIEGIFYIGLPCMSGGSNGALTTLPAIYTSVLGQDMTGMAGTFYAIACVGTYLSLGICILYRILAEKFPNFFDNGHGDLLRTTDTSLLEAVNSQKSLPKSSLDHAQLGGGIFTAVVFMVIGELLGRYLTFLPSLAWTIIIVIIAKMSGFIPEFVEHGANYWYNFMIKVGLPILIVGLAASKVDLGALIASLNIKSFLIICLGIVGSMLGAALGSRLFGMHRYEGTFTAALCSCNIGGSGDLQMCAATDRMDLLAFASISTRLGGGLMVVWVGLLYPIFCRIFGLI